MVILVGNRKFSRPRMTKRTSPLNSSREITQSNFIEFRDSRNFTFFEAPGVGWHMT